MWTQNRQQVQEQLKTFPRGYVRVDLDAVRYNMEQMHALLPEGTRMLAVVKANGYGHGAVPIAAALEQLPYLYGCAVATAEEAFELREAGFAKPIVLLGYAFPYAYGRMVREEIRPAVFREDTLRELAALAREIGKPVKLHIAVDTGMGRIGISPDEEGLSFVRLAAGMPELEIEGIFTHFARADERDKTSAEGQLRLFRAFSHRAEEELGREIPLIHCANSAAILELPDSHRNLVRAGITMYGLHPSDEVEFAPELLRPVLSLHSHISFVKWLRAGQSVSYGGTFTAEHDMRIATVPLGYGDGYPRSLSGRGEVLIRGKRCRILGRVCMDQLMTDVTHLPDVREGEPVTLLGEDGAERITAEELGAVSGRFNYELVCLLGTRLPRVCVESGEPVCTLTYA